MLSGRCERLIRVASWRRAGPSAARCERAWRREPSRSCGRSLHASRRVFFATGTIGALSWRFTAVGAGTSVVDSGSASLAADSTPTTSAVDSLPCSAGTTPRARSRKRWATPGVCTHSGATSVGVSGGSTCGPICNGHGRRLTSGVSWRRRGSGRGALYLRRFDLLHHQY